MRVDSDYYWGLYSYDGSTLSEVMGDGVLFIDILEITESFTVGTQFYKKFPSSILSFSAMQKN